MKPLLLLCCALLLVSFLHAQPTDTTRRMDTIKVQSSRRFIDHRIDKTVIQVEAMTTATGLHLLDLLRQSPGVAVDAADNLLMSGRTGVQVYIDGQPSNLTGNDLALFLKSVDASTVKEIEIIANPSSRYDAAGNAGIINIRMKRSLTDGFNGSISGSYVQSDHARQSSSVNLNGKRGKVRAFLNFSQNSGLQHTVAQTDRRLHDKAISQEGIEIDRFWGNSLRTGMDLQVGLHATLGAIWMRNEKFTGMDNRNIAVLQRPFAEDSFILTRSMAPFYHQRNSYNFNYAYARSGRSLSINIDGTLYSSSVNNELGNTYRAVLPYATATLRNEQGVRIGIGSAQADYRQQLRSGLTWESGAKYLHTATDNSLRVSMLEQLAWKKDTGRTNFFRLQEKVAALYGSMSGGGQQWRFQAGLRAELTQLDGRSTDLKGVVQGKPDTSYLSLFPFFSLQYKRSTKHQFSFNAARRIDRPPYQDVNPFIYAIDGLNSERGNPALRPQMTSSIEVGYIFQSSSSFKIRYAHTSDLIEQLIFPLGDQTVQLPQNSGTRRSISFNLSSSFRLASWWSCYGYFEPFFSSYNTQAEAFSQQLRQQSSGWGANGYLSQTFTLGKGWKGDVNGWINLPANQTIYRTRALGSVNGGVQKLLKGERLSLRLSVTDIFNTQQWTQTARTAFLDWRSYRKWESRNITLGLSLRFGNSKVKGARERQTEGEKDSGRIKS